MSARAWIDEYTFVPSVAEVFYLAAGAMFLLFDIDYLVLIIAAVSSRLDPRTPKAYGSNKKDKKKRDPDADPDELPALDSYPKVIIQLPMYNEEACCDVIVQHCCRIQWPHDKLLIQVLDDSTKVHIREKVDDCVAELQNLGFPVQRLRRENRQVRIFIYSFKTMSPTDFEVINIQFSHSCLQMSYLVSLLFPHYFIVLYCIALQGYKAGAMVEALDLVAGEGWKYCAIFDADFQPPVDFLYKTIPHLEADDNLAFVQTRWIFANVDSLLTWGQKINLDFHFCVEQVARSYMGAFFNFNGTAGVWRLSSIEDAGGWESDTVTEDMDLSLRVYLKNWSFLYLHDVECLNELPSTFKAYRTQQFRWLAGPMQIVRKSLRLIWNTSDISFSKKLTCYFFFIRYIIFSVLTVACLFIPIVMVFYNPLTDRNWVVWFFIGTVNMATVLCFYVTLFAPVFILFSITVGYYKTFAMLAGALNLESAKSWVVTTKSGGNSDKEGNEMSLLDVLRNILNALRGAYPMESAIALYYFILAGISFYMKGYIYGGFLLLLAFVFALVCMGDTSVVLVKGCTCCRRAVAYADKTIPDENHQTNVNNLLQFMFGLRNDWGERMTSLWGRSNTEVSTRSGVELNFHAATRDNPFPDEDEERPSDTDGVSVVTMDMGGIYKSDSKEDLYGGNSNPVAGRDRLAGSNASYTSIRSGKKVTILKMDDDNHDAYDPAHRKSSAVKDEEDEEEEDAPCRTMNAMARPSPLNPMTSSKSRPNSVRSFMGGSTSSKPPNPGAKGGDEDGPLDTTVSVVVVDKEDFKV
jgi:cellulose synthase/poly-beta-1,6-N-acetylglucosamine synthase-like glycosyltransferase